MVSQSRGNNDDANAMRQQLLAVVGRPQAKPSDDRGSRENASTIKGIRGMMAKAVKAGGKAPKWFASAAKRMGVSMGIAGILKQSQVFTGVLGSIFQILGAMIDTMLAPFIKPVFMPLVKSLAAQIPKARAWGEWLYKKFVAIWPRIKAVGEGVWAVLTGRRSGWSLLFGGAGKNPKLTGGGAWSIVDDDKAYLYQKSRRLSLEGWEGMVDKYAPPPTPMTRSQWANERRRTDIENMPNTHSKALLLKNQLDLEAGSAGANLVWSLLELLGIEKPLKSQGQDITLGNGNSNPKSMEVTVDNLTVGDTSHAAGSFSWGDNDD